MESESSEWERVDWFNGARAASDELALFESMHDSSNPCAYPTPKPHPKPVPKPLPVPSRRMHHDHGPRAPAPLQVSSSSSHRRLHGHRQQSIHSVSQLKHSVPLERPPLSNSTKGSRIDHSGTPLPVPNVTQPGPDSLQPFVVVEPLAEFHEFENAAQSVSQLLRLNPSTMAPPSRVSPMTAHSRVRHTSASQFIMDKWLQLLTLLGSTSNVWVKLQDSQHQQEHMGRIIDGFAPNTVLKYISACINFLQVCFDMHIDFCQLSDVGLSDLLLTIHLAKSSDASGISCSSTIKALRWLHRVAEVQCLACAYSSMVSSFMGSKIPKDKKEAPPLPLYVVAQWERRMLQSQSTTFEMLILGAFLFQLWSGLRFADMQRLTLTSLVYDSSELRGMAWRSKTSVSGVAFGIVASGFLSHGSHTWVWKFLSTLDRVLHDLGCTDVDFLLPACTLTEFHQPYAPMSYASALHFLRYFLGCPWKEGVDPMKGIDLNYTVHSLKATLLSWAPQLDVPAPPEQRLQQGHHSDGRPSMRLYSRDSVRAQLSFQRSVISHARNKWIPKIAQHRGSQLPLRKPPVFIEGFKKGIPSGFQFQWFEFDSHAHDVPTDLPDSQEKDLDGVDSS